MKKKIIIASSVSVALLIVIALVTVGYRVKNWGPEEWGDHAVEKLSDRLDLTDEQTVEVKKLKYEIIEEAEAFRPLRREIGNVVIKQFRSERFNKDQMNRAFEKGEKQFKKMRFVLVEKASELHAVLTPEQREKLAEEIEKHAERHRRWHR